MKGILELQSQIAEELQSCSEEQLQRQRSRKPQVQIVYHCRKEMAKGIVSVPQDMLDERIVVIDNLYGKYDMANLVDNDFIDYF